MAKTSAAKKAPADLIPAYKPQIFPLKPNNKFGGFFTETNTIKPFSEHGADVYEILESITAAAEAGVVDRNRWVSQFFANSEVFDNFMENLESYDQCYRIVDQWYRALFHIVDLMDEEGFVTSAEIVEKLREQAQESGQIEA